MRDHFDFDTVPFDEDCVGIGHKHERVEATAFLQQLERMFPEKPDGCGFKIVGNPHDFGVYLSVRLYYRDEREDHVDYMLDVESSLPEHWDEEAKLFLTKHGYEFKDK